MTNRNDTKFTNLQPKSCVLLPITDFLYTFLLSLTLATYYTVFVDIILEIDSDIKLNFCLLLQIDRQCETP